MKLQKFSKILLLTAAILFLAAEFFIWKVYPEDISLGSYLSGFYASILAGKSNKSIKINLQTYDITLWEGDKLQGSYKISGTGNPKLTPTPKGKFKVLSKEKVHISGLSGVAMPWSLRFYKGYYMHGIPYWPKSKQLITSKYSSGCLRLPADVDRLVYDWADIGTKVEIN